jgi:hypothetical protein
MDQAGIPQQAREEGLDDLYGPSPEERAQQGEEGSGGEGR